MDSVMTHLQAAVAMGEEIVDRNPNFCMTSECARRALERNSKVPVATEEKDDSQRRCEACLLAASVCPILPGRCCAVFHGALQFASETGCYFVAIRQPQVYVLSPERMKGQTAAEREESGR